jgi:uncharacterized membrane protein YeaQ/YmgE (transglycosylase-associated protein family)
MKLLALVLLLASQASGCAVAQSAFGALTGTKPVQVTVVNNLPPSAPLVAPHHDEVHHGRVAAVVGGGVAGAVVGGLAGAAFASGTPAVAGAALVGAGVGAALGLAVHEVAD